MKELNKISTKSFPIIYAEGSHYDVGFQIGVKCKEDARYLVRAQSSGEADHEVRKCLPYATDFYPEYVDEIRGYADGAGLRFGEMAASVVYYGWASHGCTDVAVSEKVTADRSVLVAHNEDWYPQDAERLYLVQAKVRDEPEFIAVSYGGIIPAAGLNSRGIGLTGNSVFPNDTRIGIPMSFPVRKILAAGSLEEAIRASIPPNRASSLNNVICNSEGEIYSVEGSATDFEAIYGTDGYLVHTNHYVSDRMRKYEEDPTKNVCSIIRYNRALKLLRSEIGRVTVESLGRIMSDHFDFPSSICRHFDEKMQKMQTLFSVIVDPLHLMMWISHGNPCSENYVKYQLK